jgi:hypothetical protein
MALVKRDLRRTQTPDVKVDRETLQRLRECSRSCRGRRPHVARPSLRDSSGGDAA